MSLHPINQHLPHTIHPLLQQNDQENHQLIEEILQQIIDGDIIVNSKIFGKVLRLIESRFTMKYHLTVEILSNYLNFLIKIYLEKRVSIPMKIKSLNVALKILKYRKSCLNVVIPWENFWEEIFSLCTRTAKDQSIACEGLNMKLFEALTNFVHEARSYFPSDSYNQILSEAMGLLDDLRNPMCFFGLQMLVLLLPTSLPSSIYEKMFPQWVELFTKISDNEAWDCCFLTLFCRARKYLTAFDWTTLIPLLQVKTKNLLQFPVTKGKQSRGNSYPNSFPPYIVALKVSPMDYRKTALKKMAKLLYLISYKGEIVSTTACTITPPIQARDIPVIGMNQPADIHFGAKELVHFLQIHRSFFYPSNTGTWTADIGYFLLCLSNEMGQHLGLSVLSSLELDSSIIEGTSGCFSADIHQPTMKYLCGALTSIALEGLYGKSPFMIQSCNFCLRNLCAIEPSLGHVIMPFLLSSLHPDAVNQSHMAPASLTAINHIFKPLLYPAPVALPYFDELLQLSLAGIDPNDSQKTMTTLAMYNAIFSWIPTSSIGNDDVLSDSQIDCTIPPLYLDLKTGIPATNSEHYAILFNDKVANVIISWYPKFIDKIFSLLNSKEKSGDSKATRQSSPITPYIEESFYEIISCLTPRLRLSVTDMVLEYSNSSHATNAIKEIGKMFENLLALDPSQLPNVLDKLIDLDLISCDGSNERLSMKIRLIGACLRRAGGACILGIKDKIRFLFEDEFKHHSEKMVRKAVCKFYKDLLKGLASFYVLPFSPDFSNNQFYILGKPHHADNVKVAWHIPSVEAVTEGVTILKSLLSTSMNAVESIFAEQSTLTCDNTVDQSISVKKQEERLLTHLQIVRRCLRGAAEILGESSSAMDEEKHPDTEEDDLDAEINLAQEGQRLLVETGRSNILQSLPVEDRTYLESLRYNVVSFLNRIYVYLSQLPSNSSPIIASLQNNPSVHSVWMKIFGVTVMIRMAMLKNIDQVKKWFSLSKRMVKSSTTTFMEKKLKRIEFTSPTTLSRPNGTEHWNRVIQACEYWVGHDLSPRSISDRSWIQHVLREKELSYQSTLAEQRLFKLNSAYVIALNNLSKICGHEYDAIRSKAIKIFKEVSSRFGSSLEMVLRPLLTCLSTPGTLYSTASGALSVLSLDLVQKRVCGNASLSTVFLRTVRSFPNLINSVEEVDKREKLANKMSVIFGKFLSSWHHIPFSPWTSTNQKAPMSRLLLQFLGDFGVRNSNDIVETTPLISNAEVIPAAINDAIVDMGIRQELYLASTITVFLGHNDIEVPVGVWEWAITNVSNAHGQPLQLVSLATLTKLATIEYRKVLSNSSSAQTIIQNLLGGLFNSSNESLAFLSGISSTHAHLQASKTNNAQWSKGVDIMLRNSEYVRNVLPRTETSYCDISVFSSHFKHSNAAMLMQLLSLSEQDSGSFQSVIGNLLQSSNSIPSTSEEEMRSANTVRAELFSGSVRFLRHKEDIGLSTEITGPLWLTLISYFNENISKISQDYCSDWAEGLAFGFSGSPNSSSNPICSSLLRSVQQLLLFSDSTNSSPAESTSSGFAKDTKTLLLMRALLIADISSVSRSNNSRFIPVDRREVNLSQKSSEIGKSLLGFISEASSSNLLTSIFVSPYLSVRVEMAKLFVRLADVSSDKTDLGALLQCTLFGTTLSPINTEDDGKTDTETKQVDAWKQSCDISCRFLERLFHSTIFNKYESHICPLLNVAVEGCGHYELEFSKLCHQICLKTSEQIKICTTRSRDDTTPDVLYDIIQLFSKHINSPSLHVRETVIICLGIIFINNYPLLTSNEKKICKDIFTSGLHDPKPEVQALSIVGMTTYLSIKTIDELTTLAGSYVKNSDILATREKKKRKQNKDASSSTSNNEKPDPIYLTTIKMSACMILLFPYDLPKYLPTLITSFIRHDANPVMKETIMKTIQEFKRTHQDRWNEFQLEFTREQLDDLQGAGAAHYFS